MVVIYSYPYPFDFAFFSRIQSQHLTMVTHSRCRRGYAACSPYPQNNKAKVRPPKSDPLNQTPKTSSETSLTVEYKSYNML